MLIPATATHCICTHRDHQGKPSRNTDFDAQTLLCSSCKTGHEKSNALRHGASTTIAAVVVGPGERLSSFPRECLPL
jgi:hypothetical protein